MMYFIEKIFLLSFFLINLYIIFISNYYYIINFSTFFKMIFKREIYIIIYQKSLIFRECNHSKLCGFQNSNIILTYKIYRFDVNIYIYILDY